MSDDMLPYYDHELAMLRTAAANFASQHPKVAGRLAIGGDASRDPHVERLLQGTAFLAADIQKRLDDDFPELSDYLLDLACPHYLRPVPSMGIIECEISEKHASLTAGYPLPRGTKLDTERVDDEQCTYRTCFDLTLWPIRVTSGALLGPPFRLPIVPPASTAAALTLTLETLRSGVTFSKMPIEHLRFHLHADLGQSVYGLYELLLTRCLGIIFSNGPDDTDPVFLSPEHLVAAGFEDHEAALPVDGRIFSGYRMLTEFFVLPQKYLFIDIEKIPPKVMQRLGPKCEISILLSSSDRDLMRSVSSNTLRLGCTPAVNLFEKTFDPLTVDGSRSSYCLTPDVRRPHAIEVYSVDRVMVSKPGEDATPIQPFYRLAGHWGDQSSSSNMDLRWMTRRKMHREPRPDGTIDAAGDVWISLVDTDAGQAGTVGHTVHSQGLCSNRNLPSRLPFAIGRPRLTLRDGQGPVGKACFLSRPTPSMRIRPGARATWKLISHLSLNHLSLAGHPNGEAALAMREVLNLYLLEDLEDYEQKRRWIEGLRDITSRQVAARVGGASGQICQGVEVCIELDEECFDDKAEYLMSSVLERFYAAWVHINSFTRLVSTSRQRESRKEQWRWPPRSGGKVLV
ncbi:MAG: type VI secretion system baseplate subunit TssF [Pirellulales bacterium]